MSFSLISGYKPAGDQPEAIRQLTEGIQRGEKYQVLLGVTGSGKTFTIANVIAQVNKPTLVLSHNKTLAAQLYSEFRQFFPHNRVEYFVSYYDYYQPEAYLPVTDTYIEKDLSINEEIERLRLSATSALLSGRRDVIVVSSVSCLYGIGNPEDFHEGIIELQVGQRIARNSFLHRLVDALYARTEADFRPGTFRVKGETVDIYLAYEHLAYRVVFFGDEIEALSSFDPLHGTLIDSFQAVKIFPANIFVTSHSRLEEAIKMIQYDLQVQVDQFQQQGKFLEARRLQERVNHDIEMLRELGYCSGIENYSRYFDGRRPGQRPFCLLDYFPDDYLVVIDESHVTVPQIRAMYGGDFSRKSVLVEYGFRLPAAIDNRPLTFEEFESLVPQVIYVSATPAEYELAKCGGVVVEQVVRPTGLLDPVIEVRPTTNQIDHLIHEIQLRVKKKERVLVTTLTKRMAEELSAYLVRMGIRCRYIHSDVETLDRVKIMDELRKGVFDVLVGVNLLREGLDLPEVSLVAILDADKEGFLRSERSLTQTAGRAARNLNGKVIMYADVITESMRKAIEETNRRREKQLKYNEEHGITPTQIVKNISSLLSHKEVDLPENIYVEREEITVAADPLAPYMSIRDIDRMIEKIRKAMEEAARVLDFSEAARLRDEMYGWMKLKEEKQKKKR